VLVTNDIGVVSTTLIEDLKLSYKEDTLIHYLIPAKVKSLTLTLKA
jgi:hypothetical protein